MKNLVNTLLPFVLIIIVMTSCGKENKIITNNTQKDLTEVDNLKFQDIEPFNSLNSNDIDMLNEAAVYEGTTLIGLNKNYDELMNQMGQSKLFLALGKLSKNIALEITLEEYNILRDAALSGQTEVDGDGVGFGFGFGGEDCDCDPGLYPDSGSGAWICLEGSGCCYKCRMD